MVRRRRHSTHVAAVTATAPGRKSHHHDFDATPSKLGTVELGGIPPISASRAGAWRALQLRVPRFDRRGYSAPGEGQPTACRSSSGQEGVDANRRHFGYQTVAGSAHARQGAGTPASVVPPVSYTHLTLPTNREV